METKTLLILLTAAIVLPVIISMVIEAMRRPPEEPETLYWNKDIPIQYTHINDMRIRYIQTGQGPNLVLLHTLRTQLDIFQKIIPALAKDFTVYALDYPGHGYSDIPRTEYQPDLFVTTVEKFLEQFDIDEAILVGISIGGSIPLFIAARHNPRVSRIVSINPYDYAKGGGVGRGNLVARLIFSLARIPIVGETVMRFRQPFIERIIMQGGVADPASLPEDFLEQVFVTGERKGHYRAFINLIRNAFHWEEGHKVYGNINIPVHVIYGDQDWSKPSERQQTVKNIPAATMEEITDGGHFLSLDKPEQLINAIRKFAGVS